MRVINDYNRTWAIRYLREALVEYHNGKGSQREDQSQYFMAAAVRKAQLALEHALGAPEYLEVLVADAVHTQTASRDPTLSLLSAFASLANILSQSRITWTRDLILKITREALQGALTIVQEITSEKNLELEPD